MMRLTITTSLSMLLVCAQPGLLHAGDAVLQTVGKSHINWSEGNVTATGNGAPDLKPNNPAQARFAPERVARLNAFHNALEAVKRARLAGSATIDSHLLASPPTLKKVQGMVRNFKVLETRYYSDGGVDVKVSVPLNGPLFETLIKGTGSKVTPGEVNQPITGVIVHARGLGAQPALAPHIQDPEGVDVYAPAFVSPAAVRSHGMVAYARSLDAALKNPRVSNKPLVIKATALAATGSSNLVISAEDAARLRRLAPLLTAGKVMFIID